ncbi:MAG: hypothetical protein JWN61_1511 [Pseudonocardiales bacterium]|nr:hypothetical protein [Pseudonocardiales bacterium]
MKSARLGPVRVVVATAFGMGDVHLLESVEGTELVSRPDLLGPAGPAPTPREGDAVWQRTPQQQAEFEA